MIKHFINKFKIGNSILKDRFFIETKELTFQEKQKPFSRTEIINFLLELSNSVNYLEIGVRNPDNNFNKIYCGNKYSIDPGIEYADNPVDFKMTSDQFFNKLDKNVIEKFDNKIKFDVIFIDGLHLAEQVEKDIYNSLRYIKKEGFIVLHDCNPPSEFHQRENYNFKNSPAGILWNGTTWKAFYKFRNNKDYHSICFDTDWGVGVISKKKYSLFNNLDLFENPFYEYAKFQKNKKEVLNLQDFLIWKSQVK